MTVTRGVPDRRRALSGRGLVLSGLAVALLIVLWGGYAGHWKWTGINGHTATLWDWLHVVLLPLAVAILPLWLRHRGQLGRSHRAAGFGALATFLLLVLVGYVVPWGWTGFRGNTLWNWLELLVLPVAVGLIPLYRELAAEWNGRRTAIVLAALAVFLIPVVGGYLGGWRWTGFRGNTLYDWLALFLLPLLLPTVIVPGVLSLTRARLPAEPGDESGASA